MPQANSSEYSNILRQLGKTFKSLRERSGAELRHVAERIDLGHGFNNKGSGVIKRVALLREFEEGKPDTLTAAHWVNIAEFFNIPFTNFIEEKGWPAPSLECAVYVIKCLQERFPDTKA
jgi:transcriptional regulator with XRE-family HTH domain